MTPSPAADPFLLCLLFPFPPPTFVKNIIFPIWHILKGANSFIRLSGPMAKTATRRSGPMRSPLGSGDQKYQKGYDGVSQLSPPVCTARRGRGAGDNTLARPRRSSPPGSDEQPRRLCRVLLPECPGEQSGCCLERGGRGNELGLPALCFGFGGVGGWLK